VQYAALLHPTPAIRAHGKWLEGTATTTAKAYAWCIVIVIRIRPSRAYLYLLLQETPSHQRGHIITGIPGADIQAKLFRSLRIPAGANGQHTIVFVVAGEHLCRHGKIPAKAVGDTDKGGWFSRYGERLQSQQKVARANKIRDMIPFP
jgi:hypothetical protein